MCTESRAKFLKASFMVLMNKKTASMAVFALTTFTKLLFMDYILPIFTFWEAPI